MLFFSLHFFQSKSIYGNDLVSKGKEVTHPRYERWRFQLHGSYHRCVFNLKFSKEHITNTDFPFLLQQFFFFFFGTCWDFRVFFFSIFFKSSQSFGEGCKYQSLENLQNFRAALSCVLPGNPLKPNKFGEFGKLMPRLTGPDMPMRLWHSSEENRAGFDI